MYTNAYRCGMQYLVVHPKKIQNNYISVYFLSLVYQINLIYLWLHHDNSGGSIYASMPHSHPTNTRYTTSSL